MAYKIKWTTRADDELDEILTFLETTYNSEKASDLLLKIYDVLDSLTQFPLLGTVEIRNKNIRGLVIAKYLKLFYRVEGFEIILLNFFDTRQNPNQKVR